MAELTHSTREAARRLGVSDTTMHKAERTGRIAREPSGKWDITKTRTRLLDVATANATIDEIASTMRDALLNWPARDSGNTMLSREFLCGIEGDGEPSSVPPQRTMALIF